MIRPAFFLATVICLSFIFWGCTKTGSTGPAGPAGTANVLYSTWNSLKMSYNSADSAYEQTIAADSVTQAVLDSGLVLCYIKYSNSSSQVQVESANNYMEVVLALKSIALYSYNYDYSGVSFRYLIAHGGSVINGRVAASAGTIMGYTKAEWKAMPYDKAVALLNTQ